MLTVSEQPSQSFGDFAEINMQRNILPASGVVVCGRFDLGMNAMQNILISSEAKRLT
jgi:hypothetical protein